VRGRSGSFVRKLEQEQEKRGLSGYFSRQHQKHRSEIEIGRRKNICEADPVPDLVGRTIGLVLVSGDGTSAHCTVDPKQRETFLRILRAQP
jgi:hypothetical protein